MRFTALHLFLRLSVLLCANTFTCFKGEGTRNWILLCVCVFFGSPLVGSKGNYENPCHFGGSPLFSDRPVWTVLKGKSRGLRPLFWGVFSLLVLGVTSALLICWKELAFPLTLQKVRPFAQGRVAKLVLRKCPLCVPYNRPDWIGAPRKMPSRRLKACSIAGSFRSCLAGKDLSLGSFGPS